MTPGIPCPCASGAPYAACCGPVLSGQARAMTATALMRSRYTAYVERDTGYLLRTWHPSTRPPALDPATIPDWCGLAILRAELGRETDDEGIVEFVATARMDDKAGTLHEVSRFVKEAGQWLYVAEERVAAGTPAAARSTGKVGRNDRCPCGSGNKYKKCCGR